MSQVSLELLALARKVAKKQLREETTIMDQLSQQGEGEVLCPFCKYIGKNKRPSARIKNSWFKCFACAKAGKLQ